MDKTAPTRKRCVWVVEMKNPRSWNPVAEACLTRKDARAQMGYYWKFNNPHDEFRVCKYERVRR